MLKRRENFIYFTNRFVHWTGINLVYVKGSLAQLNTRGLKRATKEQMLEDITRVWRGLYGENGEKLNREDTEKEFDRCLSILLENGYVKNTRNGKYKLKE